jgi:hypothetical protein
MAQRLQAAEEKLKRAKGTDTQTIFETEMEAIRNFHTATPPRGVTPDIPGGGNQNPPPPAPPKTGATVPPDENNEGFDYFQYYTKVRQRLGSDTFSNHQLRKKTGINQQPLSKIQPQRNRSSGP